MIEETLSFDLPCKLLNHVLLLQILLRKYLYCTNKPTLFFPGKHYPSISSISQLFYDLKPLNIEFHSWCCYILNLKASWQIQKRRWLFHSWIIRIFPLFLNNFFIFLQLKTNSWWWNILFLQRNLLHTETIVLIPFFFTFLYPSLWKLLSYLGRSHWHSRWFLIFLWKILHPQIRTTSSSLLFSYIVKITLFFVNILW